MSEETSKRATVYFEPALHQAIRLKAAHTPDPYRKSSMTPYGWHCGKTKRISRYSRRVSQSRRCPMKRCSRI